MAYNAHVHVDDIDLDARSQWVSKGKRINIELSQQLKQAISIKLATTAGYCLRCLLWHWKRLYGLTILFPFCGLQQIVPMIPETLESMKGEGSRQFRTDFAKLLHCLMYLHTGFPDLYDPILDLIKVRIWIGTPRGRPSATRTRQWLR